MNISDFDKFHDQAYKKAVEVATKRGFVEQIDAFDDIVIVRRTEALNVTDGGIHLPGKVKKINQGLVISAGESSGFTVGDKVIFGEYSGSNQVELNGEFLLVMRKSEICGRLNRKAV